MEVLDAAMAAEGAAEVFDYNRENFMEDREMRMKKEFQERKIRCDQAALWREDVRDFVELTERKMKYYLLVNVLLLGFNVNLWCEGRLPEEVPAWLMMGNQIAIGGSFMFLLLTVWLSMHAAVSAQAYCARILTQMVRIPIPTWEEIEACRTNASDFEKLESRQMFRIPFLMKQEKVAKNSAAKSARGAAPQAQERLALQAGAASQAPAAGGSTDAGSSAPAPVACDPWGLEKRGDDILELGVQYGEDVARLYHIKLIRQASVYWQTYDAFARVSMSIGVNQLMLAMAYYILGYVLVQVRTPIAAFAGVVVLVCCAEVIARVDLTLDPFAQRLIQTLLVFGPMMSCLAAYHWDQQYDLHQKIAECLAPLAFFSHGLVLALTTLALRVREQENGAMMPLAFQGVLFMDVFGWIHHNDGGSEKLELTDAPVESPVAAPTALPAIEEAEPVAVPVETKAEEVAAAPEPVAVAAQTSKGKAPRANGENVAPWASEYLEGDDSDGSECSEETEKFVPGDGSRKKGTRPTAAGVTYDEAGCPVPKRPEDQRPAAVQQDLRFAKGAPSAREEVNAVAPPAKAFYEPATFMPPEGRRRVKLDELIEGDAYEHLPGELDAKTGAQDLAHSPIVTGHDNESPGVMPWRVFRNAAILLIVVWIFAGVLSLLSAAGVGELSIPVWWEEEEGSETSLVASMDMPPLHDAVVPGPSIVSLVAAGVSGSSVGPEPEKVSVRWPYPGARPKGLACDASGSHFLMTDGVAAFMATLEESIAEAVDSESHTIFLQRPSVRGHFQDHKPRIFRNLAFEDTVPCPALLGEALQDAALVCTERTGCEALVLHQRGRKIASCPGQFVASTADSMFAQQGSTPSSAAAISPSWLRRPTGLGKHAGVRELVSGLFADPSCTNSSGAAFHGCAAVSTNHGRVVNLKKRSKGLELVPSNILGDSHEPDETIRRPAQTGLVRAFNRRYLGVLQTKRRSIKVLDTQQGGKQVGTVLLPVTEEVVSFCAGGGSVFLLGEGPSPSVWRLPLPDVLHSIGADAEVDVTSHQMEV